MSNCFAKYAKICVFTRLPKQVLNEVCYTGISRTDETENRLHKYRKADFTEMDSTCLERVEVCSKPVRSKFSNCFSDVHVVLQCLHIWLVLRTCVQTYMILYVDFYNTFHCSGSDYLIDPIKPSQTSSWSLVPAERTRSLAFRGQRALCLSSLPDQKVDKRVKRKSCVACESRVSAQKKMSAATISSPTGEASFGQFTDSSDSSKSSGPAMSELRTCSLSTEQLWEFHSRLHQWKKSEF